MSSITTRAAIARVPHVGWEIAELQLDEPRAHEVRVKLMAAGLRPEELGKMFLVPVDLPPDEKPEDQ